MAEAKKTSNLVCWLTASSTVQ